VKRIPFVEEMRAAVQADRKTETRRTGKCPYRVGDVLGIGEPHELWRDPENWGWVTCRYDDGTETEARWIGKRATGITVGDRRSECFRPARRRSGRFLPDAFVRDRIRVTAIRQERLRQITEDGARAEGVGSSFEFSEDKNLFTYERTHRAAFAALWDTLHGPGERWADDPLVHVVSFVREIGP
jgi:hypothetical protein